MKPIIAIIVSLAFVAVWLCSLDNMLSAGHNHHAVKVVTPFAVPVAVPVAPYSATYYSNQTRPYTNPPKSERQKLLEELAPLIAELMTKDGGGGTVKALAEKPTMFATKCVSCHSKQQADGRPLFVSLEALTDEQRLACIQSIITEHMPKGGKLSPEEVGQLMLELSSKPKATIQSEPPPKPEGEKQ